MISESFQLTSTFYENYKCNSRHMHQKNKFVNKTIPHNNDIKTQYTN